MKILAIFLGLLAVSLSIVPIMALPPSVVYVNEGESIQTAIDNVAVGGTVMVGPGTYPGSLDINKGIKLKSSGGRDVTTIVGDPVETVITIRPNLGTVTIDGFTVELPSTVSNPNGISQGYASAEGTASIILNNKIVVTNKLRNGIQVSGANSKVIGNIVEGGPLTEDWASTGIMAVNFTGYPDADNVLIKDNHILGGMDYGIAVIQWYVGGEVKNCQVEGNIIEKTKYGGISIGGKVTGTKILNNKIAKNDLGIGLDQDFYYGYGGGNPSGTVINYNEFCDNRIDIEVYGDNIEGKVDARFNYWCSNAGPTEKKLIGPIDSFPYDKRNSIPMASILKILKRNYQKNHGTEPEGVVEVPAEPEG
jgi:parallel beta-helix repeat protein